MGKILFALAFLSILLGAGYAEEAALPVEYSADLKIDLIRYDPAPALPNAYMNLFAYVKNSSNKTATDVTVKLDLQNQYGSGTYPFSFDAGEQETKSVLSLKQDETALFQFRVKVDSEALSGSYKIKIEFGKDKKINKSKDYHITVLNRKPQIEVIESSPVESAPGKTIELQLRLRNIGSDKAYDVMVGAEEDRTVTSTGVVVERKFSSIGSSLVYVGEMDSGGEQAVSFKIGIDPNVELKSYNIPLTIKYQDSNYNSFSVKRYAGILLKEDAEVDAVISSVTPKAFEGGKSEVVIDLFNIGSGDAKYVVVEVSAENANFETSKVFIGTLEPDDFDSFKTKVSFANDLKEGQLPLKLKINYKDAYSNPKTQEKTLLLAVYPKGEAAQSAGIDPWFAIVVLIVAYFVGKRVYKAVKKK